MGKKRKQGAALRAKKRADLAAAELVESTAEQAESARVESKSDADLFVVDTVGDDTALWNIARKDRRRKRGTTEAVKGDETSEKRRRKDKYRLSEKDERQVKRLVEAHGAEGVVALAATSRKRLETKRKSRKRVAGTAKTNFDLWCGGGGGGSSGPSAAVACTIQRTKTVLAPVATGRTSMAGTAPVAVVPTTQPIQPVDQLDACKTPQAAPSVSNKLRKARLAAKSSFRPTVSVEIARSGQSYRPDAEHHQDVVGEALSIELRRNEALEYREAPIAEGMSEETLAVMIDPEDHGADSDSDEEDEESDGHDGGGRAEGKDGNDGVGTEVHARKRTDKLTRAQRNRQKRVRAEAAALTERKRTKKLLSSIDSAKKVAKEMRLIEKSRAERREQLRSMKAETRSTPLGVDVWNRLSESDPIHAPALPVALTEELQASGGGTLRTVKPKGSLVTDRVESMVSRKLMHRKKATKRTVVQGKKRKMKGGKGREYLLV